MWTTYPWIPFIPVVFFTLTILSAKLMLNGVIDELGNDQKETENKKSLEDRFSRVKHGF
ncbi:ABC-type dipeptide/oligopeptide/nickel transport system permease subunit [Bacillus pakistanensis]|uniref:ABC-type dipeptide/oligopeptide/nickel transport system permease subunit n=1 Tax=Rossellomorea pakistanensis TaxID=992288 RepID=A0ABS2NEE4_9BACI|nr:hypothetical protein [Bacillus pakistanensis]MBM7586129.1 ABC-type dipeptide/oligopeptide/nickel transport system permease subunit [Bacillus pakistanensis]